MLDAAASALPEAPSPTGATRRPWLWLGAAAGVEAIAFAALGRSSAAEFQAAVSTDDSAGYIEVARGLMDGRLIASPRTLGYPLYLAACGLFDGSFRLAIALQLVVNLAVTVAAWRLFGRLLPDASVRLRGLVAALVFVAGMGLALYLLTDFLAGACLFASVYGLIFWRGRAGQVAAACALGAATLLRPTFTLLPLLLPPLAFLAGRLARPVPARQVVAMAAMALAATATSTAFQYRAYRYLGPSSVVTFNLEATLHQALAPGEPSAVYRARFAADLARRAGAPVGTLSPTDEERWARARFADELGRHPRALIGATAATALKYLVAPVEAVPAMVARLHGKSAGYARCVRPLLFVLWLPVWLLGCVPPVGGDHRAWAFYGLGMILVVYVIGLSAMAPLQGERMRYPVASLLIVLAGARAHDRLRRRRAVS
jgi:hypothetical protein